SAACPGFSGSAWSHGGAVGKRGAPLGSHASLIQGNGATLLRASADVAAWSRVRGAVVWVNIRAIFVGDTRMWRTPPRLSSVSSGWFFPHIVNGESSLLSTVKAISVEPVIPFPPFSTVQRSW